jgi:tetratricopeptide (TPR) repeat protein
MLRRRTLLTLVVVSLVPAFLIVNAVVASTRTYRDHLAGEWAERGARDLAARRAGAAADAYRIAQEYARNRGEYRLPLAQALLAAGRLHEARAQLLTLWSDAPGDGVVNLELARLAAKDGDISAALRYYHGAIDGAWNENAAAARRDARLELARFLIVMRQPVQAQAELIALAGDLPPDPDLITDTGALLVLAGEYGRALALLRRALQLDPSKARAARFAGEAAFHLNLHRTAVRYLDQARRAGALVDEAVPMLETARAVLALDPDVRGIGSRERVRRVVRAYSIAAAALDRCASNAIDSVRAQMAEAKSMVNERALLRDRDAVDRVLALVAAAVVRVDEVCGPGNADERALAILVRPRDTP